MDKIYFPIEKTVFLPREKAPIGKMEQVKARAEVDAIEPNGTGWLCYGKLLIDMVYTPMGTTKGKHQEHWKDVSQQLMTMGKEAKEICTIIVDFIQELPDRDYTYGCQFDADVQKKTWQQIASNALEIGVDIALSLKEEKKKPAKGDTVDEEHYLVLEQDSFSLEEKTPDPARTKKATDSQPEEPYYYAAEEGCEMIHLDCADDTIVFCPQEKEEEKKTDCCNAPVDLMQQEICPIREGAGSKGQHLCEKKEIKANNKADDKDLCQEEVALEGNMSFLTDCPATAEKTETCETSCDNLSPIEDSVSCMAEMKPTVPVQDKVIKEEVQIDPTEEICLNEEIILETEETAEWEDKGCEVVPLPLPGKEKHRFWKGKKEKKDFMEQEDNDMAAPSTFSPCLDEKPAEPRKGYRLKFYVVQGGEDLAAIAEKHSVSPSSILAANKNISEEDIRTGMVLSIPM